MQCHYLQIQRPMKSIPPYFPLMWATLLGWLVRHWDSMLGILTLANPSLGLSDTYHIVLLLPHIQPDHMSLVIYHISHITCHVTQHLSCAPRVLGSGAISLPSHALYVYRVLGQYHFPLMRSAYVGLRDNITPSHALRVCRVILTYIPNI